MDQREMDAAWDRIAPGYDEFVTPSHLPLGNEGISRSGVGKGTRFLDVACGSGALSIPAARAGAMVTAVDISPTMVERLNVRARGRSTSRSRPARWTATSSSSPTTRST